MPWGDWTQGRRFVALYDGYVYFNIGLMLEMIQQRIRPDRRALPRSGGRPRSGGSGPVGRQRRALDQDSVAQDAATAAGDARLAARPGPTPEGLARPSAGPARTNATGSKRSIPTRSPIASSSANSRVPAPRASARRIFLMRAQSAVFSAAQGLLWATDRWLGANRRNLVLSVMQGLPGVRTQEGNIALRRVGPTSGRELRGHGFRPRRGRGQPLAGGPQRPTCPSRSRGCATIWTTSWPSTAIAPPESWRRPSRAGSNATGADSRHLPRLRPAARAQRSRRNARSGSARLGWKPNAEIREAALRVASAGPRASGCCSGPRSEQARRLQPLRENPEVHACSNCRCSNDGCGKQLAEALARAWPDRRSRRCLLSSCSTNWPRSPGAQQTQSIAARMRSRIRRRRVQFEQWKQLARRRPCAIASASRSAL